jgi:hypothetical protein
MLGVSNSKLYVEIHKFLNKEVNDDFDIIIEDFYISQKNLEILNNLISFNEQTEFLRKLLINDDYHLSFECNLSIGYKTPENGQPIISTTDYSTIVSIYTPPPSPIYSFFITS